MHQMVASKSIHPEPNSLAWEKRAFEEVIKLRIGRLGCAQSTDRSPHKRDRSGLARWFS